MNENNERLTPNQESNHGKKATEQKPNGRHALKRCPECSTFRPVACKTCVCGYIFCKKIAQLQNIDTEEESIGSRKRRERLKRLERPERPERTAMTLSSSKVHIIRCAIYPTFDRFTTAFSI
ncbi:DgyrCDS258 [Dimorphilus gyrociliatus]|uniref:DgyrCDS258 n=1 Tax=Dimorphilus gyrociliatus TaxID=2664684 RepID=A0A7I8V489_9ANNE|nr:DgyrCDS258 [Dimorphilus gyrociliatus]